MPWYCCVRGCPVRANGHRFPRDATRKRQWLLAIRRRNYKPGVHSIVCRNHFTADDYSFPKQTSLKNPTPILKKDAVPSVFRFTEKDETYQSPKRSIRQAERTMYMNPALKVPEITLMRVPNDPNLIARLDAARKALEVKTKVATACSPRKTRSDGLKDPGFSSDSHMKPAGPLYPKGITQLGTKINKNLQIKKIRNKLNQATQPYIFPDDVKEIRVEQDTDVPENSFQGPLYIGSDLSKEKVSVDPLLIVDEMKDENGLDVQCVKVEFERKFKDKEVQCDMGDPCCGISLRKVQRAEKYDRFSLKNFKKRRLSV